MTGVLPETSSRRVLCRVGGGPRIDRQSGRVPARAARLVLACFLLGCGVGLVLRAGEGSDGYSSLVNGLARRTGTSYAACNWTLGAACIGLAWLRGVRPGAATIVHPILVGLTVTGVLAYCPVPTAWPVEAALLLLGTLVLAVGVTAYLEVGLGAGPFETATLALRPVPFAVAYSGLQAAGAVCGFLLGADLGLGTVVIVFGVGPLVALLRRRAHLTRKPRPGSTRSTELGRPL